MGHKKCSRKWKSGEVESEKEQRIGGGNNDEVWERWKETTEGMTRCGNGENEHKIGGRKWLRDVETLRRNTEKKMEIMTRCGKDKEHKKERWKRWQDVETVKKSTK